MSTDFSIVIPLLNERGNIIPLIDEIYKNVKDFNFEIIFVDDGSTDGTRKVLKDITKEYKNIRFLFKNDTPDLFKTVVCGIKEAKHKFIVVMDGDMNHPPAKIPDIISKLQEGFDIVIASRYLERRFIINDYNFFRNITSYVSKILVKPILPHITDPLSGFFGINYKILKNRKVKGRGYKILLAIIMLDTNFKICEIPYKILKRNYGKSKLSIKHVIFYIFQIAKYYLKILN